MLALSSQIPPRAPAPRDPNAPSPQASSEATPDRLQALAADGRLGDALALAAACLDQPEARHWLRDHWIGERDTAQARALLRPGLSEDDAQTWVDRGLLAHFEGQFQSACAHFQRALQMAPDDSAALHHLGRALHNLGRADVALQAFERATQLRPAVAPFWVSLGHALRARGQLQRAAQCFQRAQQLSPALRSASLNLGITCYAMEQPEAALAAFERVLAGDASDVEALSNAGLAHQLLGDLEQAAALYRRALAHDPRHATTWYYLGSLCNELGQGDAAREALQRALQLQPEDVDAWAELSALEEQHNRLPAARAACERGLRLAPQHPQLLLERAKLERRAGALEAAAASLRALDPRRLPERLALQFHYEQGTLLDRLGQYDAAYAAFEIGNQLAARSRRRTGIDDQAFFRRIDAMRAWVEQCETAPYADDDDSGADLCFLLSFPRSGTTLLDTLLDAHPDIDSIEEKPTWESALAELGLDQPDYPQRLDHLNPTDRQCLRRAYRTALGRFLPHRSGRLVLDKLPMRSVDAGVLYRLFPQARFLFAERHPCDVVLSNFMQQYAVNEAFVHFYTLADSAACYDRVMGLWQAIESRFPLPLIRVRYERLVDDTRAELESVCRQLGVGFDPAMLERDASSTRGPIRTNSYQQVAEPINRRAVERWQRYARHLQAQLPRLRAHAERMGYSLEVPA